MASELDSSSFTSTTQESAKTRGLTSAVWIPSRLAQDGEDPEYKYCIHCTTNLIFQTKKAPTNLRSHLKSQYSIIIWVPIGQIQSQTLQQLRELYNRVELSGQIEEIDTRVFKKQLDPDIVNEALISLIIIRNLPFRAVE